MNEPIAWLTDRKTIHFDKTDAQRDSYGFIEPLYTESPKRERDELTRLMDIRERQHHEREDVISDLRNELDALKGETRMNETIPTLRDIFAMAALPALLKLMPADIKLVAVRSFEIADEMLAARQLNLKEMK